MTKGHLTMYVKGIEKAKRKENKDNEEDEQPVKRRTNRLVTGVIDAIHITTTKDANTKNAIRVHIKRAQSIESAFTGKVMSIIAYDDDRKINKAYELKFTNKSKFNRLVK